MNKYTVADVFAGAGGFSIGFQQAGIELALAIEIDSWACDTLRYNHPHTNVVTADITTLSDAELVSLMPVPLDVLIGGAPCQGFSVCNPSAGDPKDPRNSLFMEMVRCASVWKPRALVLENVPGLLRRRTATGQSVIDVICSEFSNIGYSVSFRKLKATDFGVPQMRERVFVIGTRVAWPDVWPAATHSCAPNGNGRLFGEGLLTCPSLWDAISDLPVLGAGEGSEILSYNGSPHSGYQKLMRVGATAIYNHVAMKHTKRMVARFASMSCGESVSDVPEEHRPHKRGDTGTKSDNAYDQNNRRMHPDRPCHTVPASFYANFVHPHQDRNFTPREGARIQSFPDCYRFMGKPTVVSQKLLARENRYDELHLCQYNQIGNAVPPLLAKAIAIGIRGFLDNE